MNMKRQWTQNVQVNRDVAIRIDPETFAGEASVGAIHPHFTPPESCGSRQSSGPAPSGGVD